MLTIGIVIYNEENRLQRVEQNLVLLKKFQIPVILVDNASTDSGPALFEKWRSLFTVELITRRENNMGAARADVINKSITKWVGFIDGDCEISETWIKAALAHVQNNKTDSAVGGPLLPAGKSAHFYECLFKSFLGNMNSAQVKYFSQSEEVLHLPTANVLYRREDILAVGNFDPSRVRVGEDLEMSYRLAAATGKQKKLRMEPDLALKHELPESLGPWLKKVFYYGQARGEVGFKYGVLGTYPFMLPLLFLAFIFSNIVFYEQWQGVPLAFYLAVVLGHALFYGGVLSARMAIYLMAMHFTYGIGMLWGLLQPLMELGGPAHQKVQK
jgi:GT2 family glycosyltransferase